MWGGQSACSSQALSQRLNVSKLIKFGSFAWGNSLAPCCRIPLMQKIELRRIELCAETLSEVLQNRSKIFPSRPRPPERSSGNVISLMTLNVHWKLNLWIYSLVGEKDRLFLSKASKYLDVFIQKKRAKYLHVVQHDKFSHCFDHWDHVE